MRRRLFWTSLVLAWVAFLTVPGGDFVAWGQAPEWMPTTGTHAWSRFGPRAWKEVRVRKYVVGDNGEVVRSSTTIARTRVTSVERQSYSLCVSQTVEMQGRESPSEPQTLTREVAPQIELAEAVGDQTVTIDGCEFGTQVIRFVTNSGTQRETNTIYFCKNATPQLLRRFTTSVNSLHPDHVTETTVTVSELVPLPTLGIAALREGSRQLLARWRAEAHVVAQVAVAERTHTDHGVALLPMVRVGGR